jgi:hypothetical protein
MYDSDKDICFGFCFSMSMVDNWMVEDDSNFVKDPGSFRKVISILRHIDLNKINEEV